MSASVLAFIFGSSTNRASLCFTQETLALTPLAWASAPTA